MIISFATCSIKQEPQSTEQAVEEPTAKPTQQTNPDQVIDTVLVGYEMLFEETKEDLIANNGQNIGTDADIREVSDEGIVFKAGDGENPFMPFALRLDEVDGSNGNQAFYIKFKPSAKDFGLMLSADGSAGLTIGEEGQPQLFVLNHEYMEDLEGSLTIEPDNWYHVILAMESDGLLQGVLWKDGEEDNLIFMNLHIVQSFDDPAYEGQSWEVSLGFQGVATFTINNYAYYKFENFVVGEKILEIDDNQDNSQFSKDDVLFSSLMNPKELWSEGWQGFAENGGGEFGGGVMMSYNGDMQRLEIFGEDTGACAKFNTSIQTCMSDVGMDRVPQQAVMMKFSASDITNGVRFSFKAMDEITFSFREEGIYFVDVANFFEMPITDFMPNNLKLKNDTEYFFFFAFDQNGNIRMFIFEDGNSQNQANFEYDLYQDDNDINSSDIMIYLGVGANSQFNIYEYWVYTFENLTENPMN